MALAAPVGDAAYAIDPGASWILVTEPDETTLRQWATEQDQTLEVYSIAVHTSGTIAYVTAEDARVSTLCNGKPALRVLERRWVSVPGAHAFQRREYSCNAEREYLATYVYRRGHILVITTRGSTHVITPEDQQIHAAILQTLVVR